MNNIIISQYTTDNLSAIIQILIDNNLPVSDINKDKQIFFIAQNIEKTIGCVAIEQYGEYGLFRSLAVVDAYKNHGVGLKLLNTAIKYAVTNKIEKLYLLTTTAQKYFEKHNWKRIQRDSVPETLQKSSEFASICPSTAICMELSLTPYCSEDIFNEGFNCAQSVFLPFARKAGINEISALKLATGFAAGMVYRGETCGAITGAMMALGVFEGRSLANDIDSRDKTYMLIKELYKRFTKIHGSIICKELLGMKNTGNESWQEVENEGKFDIQCPVYVKDAAQIVEELIQKPL